VVESLRPWKPSKRCNSEKPIFHFFWLLSRFLFPSFFTAVKIYGKSFGRAIVNQQLILPLSHTANYSRDAWVEDVSNVEALSWVDHWPDWTWPRMVCLYGEEGSGKTHLAHIWAKRATGVYLTVSQALEQPPYHWVKAGKPIAIDYADNLRDQEWLFHFYNLLQEAQGYALLIARQAPTHWDISLPDLRSRLQTLVSVEIQQPEDLLLQDVALKLFQERGLNVRTEAVDYLLKHCERSFTAIQSWVRLLDKLAATKGSSVTIPLIKEALVKI
jgi:chromosomal replication initiation ATPase DnaA